jgi:tetratricopeptide (TPR) repeat protein
MAITAEEREFALWLKRYIDERGITQQEVADLIYVDKSNVTLRFKGITPFTRKDVENLDQAWHEHGALLERAGFLERDRHSLLIVPGSRYLDEVWIKDRLDEAADLRTSPNAGSSRRAKRYLEALIAYLESCKEDQTTRLYQAKVRLEALELRGDITGVSEGIFQAAKDLRHAVDDTADREFAYDYASGMSDLAVGRGRYEQALTYQEEALRLTPALNDPRTEKLWTEIAIANIHSYTDPENPAAMHVVEDASAELEVPSYPLGDWPIESPSYLGVLQTKLNLQLGLDLQKAGETLEVILRNFLPSPAMSDDITTLVAAAEFYALDHQEAIMEKYLGQAGKLIRQHDLNYYASEIERVRSLLEEH